MWSVITGIWSCLKVIEVCYLEQCHFAFLTFFVILFFFNHSFLALQLLITAPLRNVCCVKNYTQKANERNVKEMCLCGRHVPLRSSCLEQLTCCFKVTWRAAPSCTQRQPAAATALEDTRMDNLCARTFLKVPRCSKYILPIHFTKRWTEVLTFYFGKSQAVWLIYPLRTNSCHIQ